MLGRLRTGMKRFFPSRPAVLRTGFMPAMPAQVELLEERIVLSGTSTGQYGGPFSVHEMTVSLLNNNAPADFRLNIDDNNIAQISGFVIGPPGAFHSGSPRVEILVGGVIQETITTAELGGTLEVDPGTGRQKVSFNASLTLQGGNNTLSFRVVRGVNSATPVTFNVLNDNSAPGAPSQPDLLSTDDNGASNSDNVTTDSSLNFDVGSIETGATVELLRDGVVVDTLASAPSATVTLSDSSVAPGTYQYTARQTDVNGNLGPVSAALSVTVQGAVAPSPPGAPDLQAASDTGRSSTDNRTNAASPTFDVASTAPGALVELLRNGVSVASVNSAGGLVSLTDAAAPAGTFSYSARQTVGGLTSAASSTIGVTIDRTLPGAPAATLDETSDGIDPSVDTLTNDTTPRFVLGTEADGRVTVSRNGTPLGAPLSPLTPTAGQSISEFVDAALPNGTYTYAFQQEDLAGNLSPVTSRTIRVDGTNPVVANLDVVNNLAPGMAVAVTDDQTPTIQFDLTDQRFTGFGNQVKLELFDGGTEIGEVFVTIAAGADGTVTLSNQTVTPNSNLALGMHSLTVRATDQSGRTFTSGALSLNVVAPANPPLLDDTVNLGGINHTVRVTDVTNDTNGDGILFNNAAMFPTTDKQSPIISVHIDQNNNTSPPHNYRLDILRGATVVATTGDTPAGTSTDDLELQVTNPLPLGSSTLTVRFTNLGTDASPKNVSADLGTFDVRVNNLPVAPNQTVTVNEDATVGSPASLITLSTSDPDAGDSTQVRVVTLPAQGQLFTTTGTPVSAGTILAANQLRYVPPANLNGSTFTSFQFDVFDGREFSSVGTVTVNVAPVADPPSVPSPAGTVNVDQDAAPVVFNLSTIFSDPDIATNGDALTFTIEGNTNPGLVTPTINGSQLTLTFAPLADGAAQVQVRATDSSNLFVVGTFNITVNDLLDPPAITSFVDDAALDTGSKADGDLTNDALPLVNGLAEAGATITLHLDNPAGAQIGAPITVGAGQSTWSIQTTSALANGSNTIVAVATRGAETTVSQPFTIVVDTQIQQPVIQSVSTDSGTAGDRVTSDTTPDFSGTAGGADASGPVAISILNSSNQVVATGTVAANGAWTAPFSGVALGPGTHTFTARATDGAGNQSTSASFSIVVDNQNPVLQSLSLQNQQGGAPQLPTTQDLRPTVQFNLNDQRFQSVGNQVTVRLFDVVGGVENLIATQTYSISAGADQNATLTARTITSGVDLAGGVHTLRLRATDLAGNQSAPQSLNISIFAPQPATTDAPATPVYTELWDLRSVTDGQGNPLFNDSQLWQMSFDKETQTIWMTTEAGTQSVQFDPATGQTRVYDYDQILSGLDAIKNPHGTFFDFNGHVNPRIWVAHRNGQQVPGGRPGGDPGPGRLSYIDLRTEEVVTYDVSALLPNENLTDMHAVFVDARGTVWATSAHGNKLLEIDFDFDGAGGELNSTIDATSARVVVHDLPPGLLEGVEGFDHMAHDAYDGHALKVIIDDKTGETYVWLSADGGTMESATGRTTLMRPRAGANGEDVWVTWDLPPMAADGLALENSRVPFVEVDDNDTPGDPRDDRVVWVSPVPEREGTPTGDTRGLVFVFEPGLNPDDPTNFDNSSLRVYRIPAQAGVNKDFAATQQAYVDRDGGVYWIDRLGGIGRIDLDDAELAFVSPPGSFTQMNVTPAGTTTETFVPTDTSPAPANPIVGFATLAKQYVGADLSSAPGVDQYQVIGINQIGGPGMGSGPLRGVLNAANVLFGSISRHDSISASAFAETDRRQMSVVELPTALPAGALVEGRMAFQVIRTESTGTGANITQTGALILTGRQHGQILDTQVNLTALVAAQQGLDPLDIGLESDPTSVVDEAGRTHVFGRGRHGGLVHYTLDGEVWTAEVLPAPGVGVLPAQPIAFLDDSGEAAALATTSDGDLMLYRTDGLAPVNLTALAGGLAGQRIFGNVDVLEDGNGGFYVYGVNLQVGDIGAGGNVGIVEYHLDGDGLTTAAQALNITPTAGQTVNETRIVQNIYAETLNGQRHLFGSDGTSRLVHVTVTDDAGNATAENVTLLTQATATGAFSFVQPYAARVYAGLTALVDDATGRMYVYGTNAGELIEFEFDGATWAAHNLTNDITRSNAGDRITANSVFGAPAAYMTASGDRHILQTNAEGEVVEYIYDRSEDRFITQNVNLARGTSVQNLRSLDGAVNVSLPGGPSLYELNGTPVLVDANATVGGDIGNLDGVNLILRLADGGVPGDQLSLRSFGFGQGQVGVNGTQVLSGGVQVGEVAFGDDENPLIVTFNANATGADVQAVLRSAQFAATDEGDLGSRTVEAVLKFGNDFLGDRAAKSLAVLEEGMLGSPLLPSILG